MRAGRSGREPYRVYEVDDFLSGAESAEPVQAPDRDGGSASDEPHVPLPEWATDRPAARRARRGVPLVIAAVVAALVMAVERRTSVGPVTPGPVSPGAPARTPQPVRVGSPSRQASSRIARLHPAVRIHPRRAPTRVVVTVSGRPVAEAPDRREPPAAAPAEEFGFER